jgi:hypothetical protein
MFLHDIFYSDCVFQTSDILIEKMKEFSYTKEKHEIWMKLQEQNPVFTTEMIESVCEPPVNEPEQEAPTPAPEVLSQEAPENIYKKLEKKTVYPSRVQDPLFWSIYIAKYGYQEYRRIGETNYGNFEMQEKQKIAEYVHEMGSAKLSKNTNYKITKNLCVGIVSDLINSPKISMSCIIACCAYYKCNIYLVDIRKKIYLTFLCGDTEEDAGETSPETIENIVLYRNPMYIPKNFKSNPYFVDNSQEIYTLEEIKRQFICLEHYDKPFKSISNFKTKELEELASRLGDFTEGGGGGGDSSSKLKKNELYSKIVLHCVWDK